MNAGGAQAHHSLDFVGPEGAVNDVQGLWVEVKLGFFLGRVQNLEETGREPQLILGDGDNRIVAFVTRLIDSQLVARLAEMRYAVEPDFHWFLANEAFFKNFPPPVRIQCFTYFSTYLPH